MITKADPADAADTRAARDRAFVRFLAIALGLGLALQVPALFDPAFLGLGLFLMWVPALAVVLAGAPARARARKSLARPWPWGMMLLASVLGWFHKVATGLVGIAVGTATPDTEHFRITDTGLVEKADFVWLFPDAGEPLPIFLLHLFVMQLAGVAIIGPLLAFGEEIGWRGYLQWEAVRRWGLARGTLFVGVVWAYWHLGFLLAGHNAGGEHAVLNALVLFPLQAIVVSFLYAWIVHRTGSVLPAICAHAANNSFPSSELFTVTSWAGDKAVSVAVTALLGLLVLALFRLAPPRTASQSERAAPAPASAPV
jgi:membrane protease YdiL (CAAX protease family)